MKYALVGILVIAIASLSGVVVSAAQTQNEAWIPGLASFILPGLGQLLNNQPDKAVVHFGVDVAILVGGGYIATLLSPYYWYSGYSIVGLAHLAWSLYSAYDAYTVAKEKGFTLGFTGDGLTLSYDF